jgi:predicted nucleic acid-binding protein
VIYLDSSALLKLLVEEAESAALAGWLAARSEIALLSSELAEVEVLRACRRAAPTALPEARELLRTLNLVPLARAVLDRAGEVDGPLLRTLDALHLASALAVRDELTSFVAYDRRLAAAAADAGLTCVTPGA